MKFDTIAKPKIYGRRGTKNIHKFSLSLTTKSLWRALSMDHLWHRVITTNYSNNFGLIQWFHVEKKPTTDASNIWSNLLQAVNVMIKWLTWILGIEQFIRVGMDSIMGVLKNFNLSVELLSPLHE